ncbi:MAG TPA: PilN domain-containing protein [Vicinamibacterales bacterium]|nr:PilN domain-containing protein [Vicinamibacterales bacterium]
MIRINLLGGERQKAKSAARFDAGQQLTTLCSLVVVAAVCGIGLWYWSLSSESSSLDAQVVSLKREAARLDTVLAEVKGFEDRRATLQQRVALIERLRQGQTVPVQLLDHVSRSLPEMLWLTDLKQEGPFLTIEGRTTTLIGLSDFVGNLGTNAVLQKPIEIMDSAAETEAAAKGATTGPELIRFKVRAALNGLPQPEEEEKGGKKKGKK